MRLFVVPPTGVHALHGGYSSGHPHLSGAGEEHGHGGS